MQYPMIENKQLEQRLILKESVVGAASLSKCAVKLSALKNFPLEMKQMDAFLREFSLYKLEVDKSSRSVRSYNLQMEEYAFLEASISSKISDAVQEIENLKEELRQEKEIREHRRQVEDFAVSANKHQASSLTKRKITEVINNIELVKDTLSSVESEISMRQGQVERLLIMVDELETKLHDDEGVELIDQDEDREHDRRVSRGDTLKIDDVETDVDSSNIVDVDVETQQ